MAWYWFIATESKPQKRCASFWRKAEKTENEENPNNHYDNFNFLNWVL